MSDFLDSLPPDLAGLGDRLRRDRPELAPLELDRIKVNVMRRKNAAPKGGFMRARLTILGFLVVGIVMMGTGGALAVTGFSSSGSAATVEYGPSGVKGVQATGTLGSNTSCTEANSPTGSTANNCQPTGSRSSATAARSPAAQVSSSG